MMEPLNKKQRQKAFWKFTMLFILSVIPICAAIFLYGRIDTAENEFLRNEYGKYKAIKTSDANINEYYERILKKNEDLHKHLLRTEPNALDNKEYGSIEVNITEMEKELQAFQNDIISSSKAVAVDSLVHEIIKKEIDNLRLMNKIYKASSERIFNQNKELKDLQKELSDCTGKFN